MMDKLRLQDLFHFEAEVLPRVKINFNVWGQSVDYTRYYYLSNKDRVNHYNIFWSPDTKTYFRVGDIVINAIKIGSDKWLVTTVKEITAQTETGFDSRVLENFTPYFDRLVLRYRPGISRIRYFERYASDIEIVELLAESFADTDFPGYDWVSLSFQQLKTVLKGEMTAWLTALSHQKAVYLLTDTKTGKLYVGSATSQNGMLLKRWQDYLDTGHGGNTGLRRLLREEGFDYIKNNFQFSILENYNEKVEDDAILSRESYWKQVLKTREFGYNEN